MPLVLPRTTPEQQGVASAAIESVVRELARLDSLHSLMIVRHGAVIAEGWWTPYRPDVPHMLYSLSKSFTSTAAGFAVAEGRVSLDDLVITYFPDDVPASPSAGLRKMRIRHLLAMCTGHETEPEVFSAEHTDSPYATFLAAPLAYEPGTHFLYNTAATFVVAAILQRVTGQTLVDYLSPRLFEPLGIHTPYWESHPNGVNFGGFGLFLTTEDIARFGQLYLQNGMLGVEVVLPSGWVTEATRSHISNGTDPNSDWNQGYGYQFWRCRHNAYRGDGAFGQYCVVIPDHDTVVAITSGIADLQAPLNVLWEYLLPALGDGTGGGGALPGGTRSLAVPALPDDEPAHASLRGLLATIEIPIPVGATRSPREAELSTVRWALDANDAGLEEISLDFACDTFAYRILRDDRARVHTTPFGRERWVDGDAFLTSWAPIRSSSSGTWRDERTFELTIVEIASPHITTVRFEFADGLVTLSARINLSFGPLEYGPVHGHAVDAPATNGAQ